MSILSIFWFVAQIKAIGFWLYLWQLKEYHAGRFIDHFRTAQGKKLFWSKSSLVKTLFVEGLYLEYFWSSTVLTKIILLGMLTLYVIETLRAMKGVFVRSIRIPLFTKKIVILYLFLILCTFAFAIQGFSAFGIAGLLVYDLSIPLIVSAVVLVFQPFAVFGRNRILAQARAKRASMQKLKVIGITGSYGKTTTKEILSHILSVRFKVAKTKEHQNSEIGVSRAILDNLKPEHEVFVCEMGAYNKGGIKLLAGIAQPQIAVLTGTNEQHLATFGSMENLLSAEGGKELVDALPVDGVAIFNGANVHAKKLYEETTKKKVLCGPGGTLVAENVKAEQEKIVFRIVEQGRGETLVEASLLGAHNAENVLLAAAVALELGMTLEEIAQALQTLPQGAGAMTLKKGKGGVHIIDSSYSANPDGVLADLEYLKVWPGKKVLVMPSLIELGKASGEAHERIGRKIAEICDLAVITTEDHVADIQSGAGDRKKDVLYIPDWKKIVDTIQSFCKTGDVVLLGGRVPSQIMKNLIA
ncbi:MAG: UDP-N-acetylmuramoyl-tripeptide--D-alanyl-D-alanine ligase [bacterium]|nr:UDP-N-acetylmuramoyl-tripeptide--D-alanyl-D-alanine ligase [bacterium]